MFLFRMCDTTCMTLIPKDMLALQFAFAQLTEGGTPLDSYALGQFENDQWEEYLKAVGITGDDVSIEDYPEILAYVQQMEENYFGKTAENHVCF